MDADLSRRDLLGRALAVGAGAVLLPAIQAPAAAADEATETARGIVFDDDAGTGKRSAGSKGIEGVLVSNGRDVVRTDAAGKYALPVKDGDVIFVIKPAGWMTPLNEYNLPTFYYFHRPAGSPQWKPKNWQDLDPIWFYKGSKPTGPLPASIDFPLRRREELDEFKVVIFGDTQISHDRQIEWMSRDTLAELVGTSGVAFGLSLGDLVNVGLCYLFEPLNQMQAKTGFPWYVVPGNHDQNLVTPNDELADEQFRSVYGPTTYAFEYGPVSFLMIENIMRRPFSKLSEPATQPATGRPAGDDYGCGLREDQWQFVENYLKTVPKDRQLVLCMHIPLTGEGADEKAFAKRLLGLLNGRPHTLSMSGHTHIQRHSFLGADRGFAGPGTHHHFNSICVRGDGYRGMFDELRIPTCQACDGTPNGYSFITFTKTGYAIRYKPSRQPTDYQMNVFVPPRIKSKNVTTTAVQANVFAGSERSVVRMRVNGGSWQPMKLTPQFDPSITWVLEAQNKPESWLGSKYTHSDAPQSFHIWEAEIGTKIPVGTHVLEVESQDMFGQVDHATTLFRVV
ncbi:MAG: calcineurin-like phosphoesterase C-terminal domain-containing protein [Tepidisphaeraceae bacterium]